MSKARIPAARRLVIDDLATVLRKPSARPLVQPNEAIAIALSVVRWKPGTLVDPDGQAVYLVLKSLKDCGWKIEPI